VIKKIYNDYLKNEGFLKYFKNTSWLIFERFLRLLSGLIITIWIARYLGPNQFGLFSYVQNFAFFFTIVATFGIDNITIIQLIKYPKNRDKILGSSFLIKIFGSFFAILTVIISFFFTNNDSFTNILILIIVSSTIFQSLCVIEFFFQATVKSKYTALANIVSLFISIIIRVVLIATNAPLIAFVVVILVENVIIVSLLAYFYFYQKYTIFSWKFDKKTIKLILVDSWPFFLSVMILALHAKIDQIFIKELIGNQAVGFYAAATKLSEATYIIPTVIISSLFPSIVNAKKINEEIFYERIQKLYSLVVWFAIVIALLVTCFSESIIKILYKEQFLDASKVLAIHIWSGVFVAIGILNVRLVTINNKQKQWLLILILGTFILLTLLYFLISKYGILGASYSVLISQFLMSIIIPLFIKIDKKYIYTILKSLLVYKQGSKN
jgi:O-antigen/teichoic acid export membrane protein